MTLEANPNKIFASGNGVTVAFAFAFKYLAEDEIEVYRGGVLVPVDEYTVTAAPSGVDGGTITFDTAPVAGTDNVLIQRVVEYDQPDRVPTVDKLGRGLLENMIDRIAMQTQQLDEITGRCLKIAFDQNVTPDTEITLTAGRAIIVNDDGDGFTLSTSDYEDEAAASAASAAAALASQNAAAVSAAAALASKVAAELAETNAETAETNAETAETNASTSASNAATSATTATTQASNAATSATTATTQASNAATSATTATTQAGNASTSATTATTQAGNASTSASNAATSATTATTQATNASTSASGAATSATNASTSASGAATSAATATTQASNASTSASTATTQASNASTSASTATTQASNASTSATNAATSATTATTQASNAATSATTATTQASNASTSASTATTQASNASTSASNAATSATTATTQASNASTSASNAATSASAAAATAAGLSSKGSCRVATTAALTVTYSNGASGVGATLTNTAALAALTIDGALLTAGARVLVKNQASGFQNGLYTVTTVGSGAVAWVMTRATDYDTSAEIVEGTFVVIQSGTVNAGTLYIMTATGTVTVGTTNLTWVSLTLSSGTVTSVTAGTGISTGGSPITNTGTVSLDINSLTTVTAVGADFFPLVDSSDSNNLKKALVSDISDFRRVGSSGTLGAVSSYIFEDDIYPSLFDGTYASVVFDFVDVAFATDATFMNFTASVASTYLAGTSYLYAATGRESSGTASSQNSTGAAFMRTSDALATGNSTNESFSGYIKVWKPNSSQWKKVIGSADSLGISTTLSGSYNWGTIKTTSALDGFKFGPSAGNFAGGEIIVYGVK